MPLYSSLTPGNIRLCLKKKKRRRRRIVIYIESFKQKQNNMVMVHEKTIHSQTRWLRPIIPALWEVKAGGSPEVGSLTLA